MTEDSENKSFKIKGDSKKRVVKFGASKSQPTNQHETQTPKELQKAEPVINDLFAKHSRRESLKEGELPRELTHQFSLNSEFETAFNKLDEGVKSGYLFYFSGPKLTASITNRIVKKIDRIIAGHGLNDCTCGLSKSLPNCDGSHKNA
ncbi:MAG: hypothetical protein JKY48_11910 [Flavobacteriales bacterium]|nr:hypothetical protein [Flavobacteriales bacterium]